MALNNFRDKVERLLSFADVKIGGDRPWDIQVHNKDLYVRLMAKGSLGLGESYMDGWWDCKCLDEFFHRVLRAKLDDKINPWSGLFSILKAKLFNLQKPSRAFLIGRHHYDIGNNLYRHMLDERLIYSSGYWKNASTLDESQEAKLDLVCRKLELQSGMKVMDIGCGWGGTARFAAERYQVEVVGITVSEEQVKFGKKLCQGLPVEIRLQDYRGLKGTFDRILSLGMFEHVGYKNYTTFMRTVKSLLKDGGIFLLHTIGGNRSVTGTDPWIERYIFPNSMLPSSRQICEAIEGLFVLEDWHSFGADYDKTLMHWFQNFHDNWDALKEEYDERFYRMWKYYLLSCAGSFRARTNQLWQIVLSAEGIPGGYHSPR
ncbi:MAG: cyclopropane fatty acyl phospholipid synthase [Deltaproteobacteria bacterium]|nr:cyclopropane fatty acyl phospholipid synthase [Deltaproteobacteria bacterium]MBW2118663.1 cyclopropane fatty acyl phospholipid synthase [Deltaproteobacteria bacterium]MBW2342775.1 cyclopropane fatty acyl phospholipid synthase [Deltaproteobacteria bacterium]